MAGLKESRRFGTRSKPQRKVDRSSAIGVIYRFLSVEPANIQSSFTQARNMNAEPINDCFAICHSPCGNKLGWLGQIKRMVEAPSKILSGFIEWLREAKGTDLPLMACARLADHLKINQMMR
jgi:hypothetical protein